MNDGHCDVAAGSELQSSGRRRSPVASPPKRRSKQQFLLKPRQCRRQGTDAVAKLHIQCWMHRIHPAHPSVSINRSRFTIDVEAGSPIGKGGTFKPDQTSRKGFIMVSRYQAFGIPDLEVSIGKGGTQKL